MKKVVLFFAVATAVALVSCGGSTQPSNSETTPVDTPKVEITETQTVLTDSLGNPIVSETETVVAPE